MQLTKEMKLTMATMFAFAGALAISTDAFAIVAPAATTFAYDVYDIAINKIVKGPIGFVAGAMAIVFGAVKAIQQEIMGAVPAILGGAILLKADTIVVSLGSIF